MVWAKTALFTVLVPGTVVVLVPHWIRAATGAAPAGLALRSLAVLLGLSGLAIYGWCVLDFGRARGTPAPIDPPRELVERGLYRFSRNPMYVGVLSLVAAQALYFASPELLLFGVALFTAFHAFIVVYEEPTLDRSFGAAYQRYRSRVPRWLGRPSPVTPPAAPPPTPPHNPRA
jgi:protein-S-isoprenylcysteine O-methyltransferase Ste14